MIKIVYKTVLKRVKNVFSVNSVSQSVSQSVGQSVSRSVGQSVSRSVGQSVSRSVGQSVSRSVGQPVSRSVGQSVSRSVGQSVSRSVGQSVSRSVGQSVSRSVGQSVTDHRDYYVNIHSIESMGTRRVKSPVQSLSYVLADLRPSESPEDWELLGTAVSLPASARTEMSSRWVSAEWRPGQSLLQSS